MKPENPTGDFDRWLPIVALAAHVTGDFLVQTDRQATEKFDERSTRAAHVVSYAACYVPLVCAVEWDTRPSLGFLGVLTSSHYVVDRKRWAEPRSNFETYPVWIDQSLHLISLALALFVAETLNSENVGR